MRERLIARLCSALIGAGVGLASLGGAGCFTSTHTEVSIVGPYVQAMGSQGPKLLVHQCKLQYVETTTKKFSLYEFFFSSYSSNSKRVQRELAATECRASPVDTGVQR